MSPLAVPDDLLKIVTAPYRDRPFNEVFGHTYQCLADAMISYVQNERDYCSSDHDFKVDFQSINMVAAAVELREICPETCKCPEYGAFAREYQYMYLNKL
jgi:hypothetical protein